MHTSNTQPTTIILDRPLKNQTSPPPIQYYLNLDSNKQNNNNIPPILSPSSNSSINKNFTQVHSLQANPYNPSLLSSKLNNQTNLNGVQDNEDAPLKNENQENSIDQLHVLFPPNFFTNLSVQKSMISCMKSYYDCYSQYLQYIRSKKKQKEINSNNSIKRIEIKEIKEMKDEEKQSFISKESRQLLISLWQEEKIKKPLTPNKMNALRAYNVQRQKNPRLSQISQSSLSRITSKHDNDQLNSAI